MSAVSSLLRVQVVGHGRRLDVCLPARVPVWEFLPEIVRGLGAGAAPDVGAEAGAAVPGLVTAAGVRLDESQNLERQGVRHGDVLAVAPVAEHHPPVLHDDLVQAVHARARVVLTAWGPGATRTAAHLVACLAAAAGLAMVVRAPLAPPVVVALTAPLAALLVGLAETARRRGDPSWCRVTLAWLAVGCAWVVGTALAHRAGPWAAPLAAAVAVAVGVMLLGTAGRRWPLYAPPVLVVTVWTTCLVGAEAMQVPAWQLLLVSVAVGVLLAGALPGVVVELTVARGQADGLDGGASSTPSSAGVDLDRLDADLVLAHRIVLAWSLTGTGLVLCAVPYAVEAGAASTAVVLLVTLLRWLRARHQRSWALSVAGVGGAVLVAVVTVACVAALRPDWVVVAVPSLAGLAVAAALARPDADSPRRAWWGDVVEVGAVVCLPVLVTLAVWGPTW